MTIISKDREGFCFMLQKHCSPLLLHFPEAWPCSLPTVCLTLAVPRRCMLLYIRFQMQTQVLANCQVKSFSPQRPACCPYELQLCTAKKGTALTVSASFTPLLRDTSFCNTTWCTAQTPALLYGILMSLPCETHKCHQPQAHSPIKRPFLRLQAVASLKAVSQETVSLSSVLPLFLQGAVEIYSVQKQIQTQSSLPTWQLYQNTTSLD